MLVPEPEHDVTIYRRASDKFVIYCITCQKDLGKASTYAEAYGVLSAHERGEDNGD
jgi:hypothetical protein